MRTPATPQAIVTGHSRGLGEAIAADLLGRGIAVLGLSRATNEALAGRYPGLLQQTALDLADTAHLQAWLQAGTLARFTEGAERVLLVNNAGVVQPMGAAGILDAAQLAQAVALSVTAPLLLANALVASTDDKVQRRVLHVSSGAARKPYAGWSVYCATKAALDMHARASQLDEVPGLLISSVAPGVIDTEMQSDIRAASEDDFPLRARFEALKREGQLESPVEVAHKLVDHLLSPAFGVEAVVDLRELASA
ncbi:MAG TPA: SDR family oxidoreductase [Candidatus Aquabacterium excrementipullorum]|nr:SDR family oxidoreductase [Candidatus Aquabacterium excrementipullorum]